MGSCQSIANGDVKSDTKNKTKPQILIKSFTWSRDSHGLFDYESKGLSKKTLKSLTSGRITRKGHDVVLGKDTDPYATGSEKDLLKLLVRDGNYWVGPCRDPNGKKHMPLDDAEDNENSLWMVVKSFKPSNASKSGYRLHEGDLMRLGRIKFRVKELRSSANQTPSSPKKDLSPEKLEKHTKIEEELNNSFDELADKKSPRSSVGSKNSVTQQACRICLGDSADAEDPFFSPCYCSGTMKYIHVLCLQRWLKSKLHKKETEFSTSVYWKTLECELCKKTYPSSFEVDGKKYDIIEVERPKCGYLMLEILSKEKNILRGIHIIKMEGKSNVRLGRGHDSDIRITDISVSRCHAIIRLDKGNFYIEDNDSKFGTLVHMRKPFALNGDYNNISLQIGRTVLSLAVKKNWKALSNRLGPNDIGNPVELEEEELFTPRSRPMIGTNIDGNEDASPRSITDMNGNAVAEQAQPEGLHVNEGEDDRVSDMPEDEEDELEGDYDPEEEDANQAQPNQAHTQPAPVQQSSRREEQSNEGEEQAEEEQVAVSASASVAARVN